MANAVANSGYQQEVSPGKVFATAQPDTIPVYRLYKFHQGLADHLYTVSAPERDNAVAAMGYTYEKIAGYIFPDRRCGSVPLIRAYDVEFGDHFYTSSEADVRIAIANSGYTREGILGLMVA
ncbi:hypothetical protein ONZ45_g18171 [Pleurotus djamor]|nr:hypothetical protein ONZ45_g18171 [Pleurotus djamor]